MLLKWEKNERTFDKVILHNRWVIEYQSIPQPMFLYLVALFLFLSDRVHGFMGPYV